ncbi:TMV resistance protein N-like isoform X2 [Prosopis cineraria]|uniref:TMV resistance protein N-like isoform X2 n=1 Tax=Prosopis cineraria TaxID=364024 RepID=UPI00240F9F7C|nr:TMV resistance protein N-like isoform X2 [Prosopis cineraria]
MNSTSVEGGSSSSRTTPECEVFLNYCGVDAYNCFISHLDSALQRNGISTSNQCLQRGDLISQVLLKAIEQSRIYIVVFSKHYADSTWCLDELRKISEVIFDGECTILPVFYHVDPYEVQNQCGSFKLAFDEHEQKFSDNIEKVQRWRLALTQIAKLPGCDVRTQSESEVVGNIVNVIRSKLGHIMDETSVQDSIMACEVFLSFHEDIRNGFISHLVSALQRKGLLTTIVDDEERIQRGDSSSSEKLLIAIAASRICVVVLSKKYAASPRCLEELSWICNRKLGSGCICPVFYDVRSSDVRHQKGDIEEAFASHEQRFSDDMEKVQRWRLALTEVANLSGFAVGNKSEAEVIDSIVEETRRLIRKRRYQRTWKYEVFLSFRGEDTRKGFTAHLFSALQRKGVFVFKDDQRLQKGDSISQELLEAIEQSRICIVVFSKHYADSTWCLEELTKISEVIFDGGCTVLPVFYDVDPFEVQTQSGGTFKESFDAYEQNLSDNIEKVQRWRLALTQVANLSGFDVRNKSEMKVIDNIVDRAIRELDHRISSLTDDLVGMQSRVEALENFLNLDPDEVRSVGLFGMPGIGKTTLAAVLFNKISYQFDASCFLHDVSGVEQRFGIIHLQQQLLSETLLRKDVPVKDPYVGRHIIMMRLSTRKILVVVDNVNSISQLDNLVGQPDWFGSGSRIIITTRDEHILLSRGVYVFNRIELLEHHDALQLFCVKAFNCDDPPSEFQDLANALLQHAKCLPLAIKVLGSRLFMKQKSEWSAELERLKEIPDRDVMEVLQTSYDLLDYGVKNVFLDIACFFNGADKDHVMNIMEYCGFYAIYATHILCERSLASIVNGKIWMHDLVQELGQKIVREKSPQHAKRSRLWSYKDLQSVNKGTKFVEAIVLNKGEVEQKIPLMAEVLSKMTRLRVLILPALKFSGQLNHLSNDLRFLSWQKFPFSYLPSSFNPKNLVELIMPDSDIRHLWKGRKCLPSLRSIDLSGSKSLVETLDLSGAESLKKINLEGCTGLLRVHPSIGDLHQLEFLNLRKCTHLTRIPNTILLLPSLETLNLCHCSSLREIFQARDFSSMEDEE